MQSMRYGGGNVQGIINYPKIKKIKIFYPESKTLVDKIESVYKSAIDLNDLSNEKYFEAENIFLAHA